MFPRLLTVFLFFAVSLGLLLHERGLRGTTVDDFGHDGVGFHSAKRPIRALAAAAREQLEVRLRTDTTVEVSSAELRRSSEDDVEVTDGVDVWVETTEQVETLAQRELREVRHAVT
jgi:hypothetical protein